MKKSPIKLKNQEKAVKINDFITFVLSGLSIKESAYKSNIDLGLAIRIHTAFKKANKETTKPKKEVKKESTEQDPLNSGFAKLLQGQTVMENIKRNPEEYRRINMLDSKNTIKEVKISDPRTDDQIRAEFKKANEDKLKITYKY